MIRKIHSKRLLLRKVAASDGAVLHETVTSPGFPVELPLKEIIKTRQDAEQWMNLAIQDWDTGQRYTWIICLNEENNPSIGQILISKRIEDDRWHTAFWISSDFQAAGYASEALSAVTRMLPFKFWAGAAQWNEPSNRVLVKCGFKKIGIIENGYICRGQKILVNEYEKT